MTEPIHETWAPFYIKNLDGGTAPEDDSPASGAAGPATPEKQVRVPLGERGTWVVVPAEPPLVDHFLADAYLLHQWAWVDGVAAELARVVQAITDPSLLENAFLADEAGYGPGQFPGGTPLDPAIGIGPARRVTPADAHQAVREYQQGLTGADLTWVQEVRKGYEDGIRRLRQQLRAELCSIEKDAVELLTTRLSRSNKHVNDEARRYLSNISRSGTGKFPFSRFTSWPCDVTASAVKELLRHVDSLVDLANAVVAARGEVEKAEGQANALLAMYGQSHGTDTGLLLKSSQAEDVAETKRDKLNQALADLAPWLAAKAELFPVLHRWSADDIIRASKVRTGAALGDIVYPILRKVAMAGSSVQESCRGNAAASRVAVDAEHPDEELADVADGSVWKYPAIIDQARTANAGAGLEMVVNDDALSLRYSVAQNVLARVLDEQEDDATREALACVAVSVLGMALHIACPVAGFLLDALLSVHDVYASYTEHAQTHDEYWCTLDPREALAAAPSFTSLAVSIAFAALTIATPPRPGR